jgi:hypothetical protein
MTVDGDIFLFGVLVWIETYDSKQEVPSEFCCDFKPIKTYRIVLTRIETLFSEEP